MAKNEKDEAEHADEADAKATAPAKKSGAEKKSGGKASDKKPDPKAAARDAHEAPKADAKEAHGAHAAGGHGHTVNRKEVWTIFVVLFVLTVLEVALAQIPGISHTLMALGLIGLAVTKAACVGLYYMHLKNETRALRLTVALPLAAPPFYALVLIAEAAWRFTG
jgi:cytochrome c oxidase subunit IV